MRVVNRLWVQLTLAYALVILVAVGAMAFVAQLTTAARFRQYVMHSEMMVPGSLVEQLAVHYGDAGNWEGVEQVLGEGIRFGHSMLTGGRYYRRYYPGVRGRLEAVLADEYGKVVFDSGGGPTRARLSEREKAGGLPITESDGEEVIGYLLVAPPRPEALGPLEQRLLDRLQQMLVGGAGLAVGLGLIVSIVVTRGITAPLRRLADATRAVAAGDFAQRLEERGSTEVAQVTHDFNEMTAALQKAEELRQNLVADVAHELRTPLSVIQGNLRAILDDVYPLEKGEVARLYDETRLLSRLVDDLRELAQVEAGLLRLDLRDTDVGDLVQRTVANYVPAAEAKSIELSVGVAGDLPPLKADPDRLVQVLRNLLTNALRHAPEGGQVAVSASVADDTSGSAVEIAVADNGSGISPEDLPHMFDRFWRAYRSHSRESGGTGLGLAIARSLVEAHGGHIWVDSRPGEGARFAFRLPIAPVESNRRIG
jgi:two-component system OmpR family sensor kinase